MRRFDSVLRSRVFSVAVVLLLAGTGVKWCYNQAAGGGPISPPCTSSRRSRLARVFAYPAAFHPSIIEFHGHEITVREAWVERRSKIRHLLVWIPYREQLDGYALCFSLSGGKEVFEKVSGSDTPLWVMDDMNQGFTRTNSPSGRTVFYQYMDVLPSDITVSLVSTWKERRRNDIRVQIVPFDQGDRIQEAIPP
jgi:hypothetical protein